MGTATFVKRVDGTGDGRVYLLDPPLTTDTGQKTEYVWVSAVDVMFSGPETYIFACDADGEVTNWAEQDGSFKGGLDHARALEGAGYEVKE